MSDGLTEIIEAHTWIRMQRGSVDHCLCEHLDDGWSEHRPKVSPKGYPAHLAAEIRKGYLETAGWRSLNDAPKDGSPLTDSTGDQWRYDGKRGWMWSTPGETGWATPPAVSDFRTAYAPYRRA